MDIKPEMVSIWDKMTWGGNPDKVDEITGLSRRDIYNIKKSWAVLYEEPEKYGFHMFRSLFRRYPSTQSLFKTVRNSDEEAVTKSALFRAHVIHFMAAINAAITSIEHPQIVMALMSKLGNAHAKKNVQQNNFEELKVVLVDYLRNQLRVKEEAILSWNRFLNFIYQPIEL